MCVCVCVCVRVCVCVCVHPIPPHELDATLSQFLSGVYRVGIKVFLLLDRLPYQG